MRERICSMNIEEAYIYIYIYINNIILGSLRWYIADSTYTPPYRVYLLNYQYITPNLNKSPISDSHSQTILSFFFFLSFLFALIKIVISFETKAKTKKNNNNNYYKRFYPFSNLPNLYIHI